MRWRRRLRTAGSRGPARPGQADLHGQRALPTPPASAWRPSAADRCGARVGAGRRHSRIFVLEDAAYRGLTFSGAEPPSVWRHDRQGDGDPGAAPSARRSARGSRPATASSPSRWSSRSCASRGTTTSARATSASRFSSDLMADGATSGSRAAWSRPIAASGTCCSRPWTSTSPRSAWMCRGRTRMGGLYRLADVARRDRHRPRRPFLRPLRRGRRALRPRRLRVRPEPPPCPATTPGSASASPEHDLVEGVRRLARAWHAANPTVVRSRQSHRPALAFKMMMLSADAYMREFHTTDE